jgi:hypothetical protein
MNSAPQPLNDNVSVCKLFAVCFLVGSISAAIFEHVGYMFVVGFVGAVALVVIGAIADFRDYQRRTREWLKATSRQTIHRPPHANINESTERVAGGDTVVTGHRFLLQPFTMIEDDKILILLITDDAAKRECRDIGGSLRSNANRNDDAFSFAISSIVLVRLFCEKWGVEMVPRIANATEPMPLDESAILADGNRIITCRECGLRQPLHATRMRFKCARCGKVQAVRNE